MPLTKELWIEREDFMEEPSKGFFRLTPDGMVRLRYGYVVKCTNCEKDAAGNVTVVHCEYLPDTKSGTPGADAIKVKGNIHWVSVAHAYAAEIRLYDRLFKEAHPGERKEGELLASWLMLGEGRYLRDINPNSLQTITAQLEPSLRDVKASDTFQFERHGYFVADRKDSKVGAPVFNRTVTLRDAWQK